MPLGLGFGGMGGTGRGDTVPSQTRLLLSWPQAPRRPQPDVSGVAYCFPPIHPSCRAEDSPNMSVLLRPSVVSWMRDLPLTVSTELQAAAPGKFRFRPPVPHTAATLFDRVTPK